MQIVLAYTEPSFEVLDTYTTSRSDGINAVPATRETVVARAMMWLNKGEISDAREAKVYADANGYRVFCYPASERDPHKV